MPVQRLAHHRPDRQIGHIVIVHDIEVDEIGAGVQHGIHFLSESGEVSAEDGGGDPAGFHQQILPASNAAAFAHQFPGLDDLKSTRLNSSHLVISYAVFCLKKKKKKIKLIFLEKKKKKKKTKINQKITN